MVYARGFLLLVCGRCRRHAASPGRCRLGHASRRARSFHHSPATHKLQSAAGCGHRGVALCSRMCLCHPHRCCADHALSSAQGGGGGEAQSRSRLSTSGSACHCSYKRAGRPWRESAGSAPFGMWEVHLFAGSGLTCSRACRAARLVMVCVLRVDNNKVRPLADKVCMV